MKPVRHLALAAAISLVMLAGCGRLDVYEKVHAFRRHEWASADSVRFRFTITDTTLPYRMYLVFRHHDAYHFRNVWIRMNVKDPDSTYSITREFVLADNEKWLGSGMNDIYEHRIPFAAAAAHLRPGTYEFTLRQVMREDPLEKVANVGLRVEKVKE